MTKPQVLATQLRAESIHLIDSKLNQDIDQKISAAVLDCVERPEMTKARKVAIQLSFQPNKKDPSNIDMSGQVGSSTPARVFEIVTGLANKQTRQVKFQHVQGELFSDYIPDDEEIDPDPPESGKDRAVKE